MSSQVKTCESCGMPMKEADQHGAHDINNPYCVYCTDETGKLKTRQEVRQGMINFYLSQTKKTREEVEKLVDEQMRNLPAWKEK